MKHLYELTSQMRGLQSLLESGELSADELADTFEALEGDIQAKGAGALSVLANLQSEASAYDTEIKRMQARKKTILNHHEWLKSYLRDNMIATGITKIESPLFTATLRKPSKVVEVVDSELIPNEYRKLTITVEKAVIKKALKRGIDIPGCRLIDGKTGIIIK